MLTILMLSESNTGWRIHPERTRSQRKMKNCTGHSEFALTVCTCTATRPYVVCQAVYSDVLLLWNWWLHQTFSVDRRKPTNSVHCTIVTPVWLYIMWHMHGLGFRWHVIYITDCSCKDRLGLADKSQLKLDIVLNAVFCTACATTVIWDY